MQCSGLPSWTEGRILLPSQAAGEEWYFVPTLVFSPESDVDYNDSRFHARSSSKLNRNSPGIDIEASSAAASSLGKSGRVSY